MKRIFGIIGLVFVVSALCVWGRGLIADDRDYVGVKSKGVVWNIAPDRQFTNAAGVYEPEGLDIYFRRHIDRIYQELEQLSNQMKNLDKNMQDLRTLIAKLPASQQSLPQPQPVITKSAIEV